MADVVYSLLTEFTYALVDGKKPDKKEYLDRCPEDRQQELIKYIHLVLWARRGVRGHN